MQGFSEKSVLVSSFFLSFDTYLYSFVDDIIQHSDKQFTDWTVVTPSPLQHVTLEAQGAGAFLLNSPAS